MSRIKEEAQTIHKPDLLFISHFHNDHTNGIKELLKVDDSETLVIIPKVSHYRFVVDLILNYIEDKGSSSIPFMLRCVPTLSRTGKISTPIILHGNPYTHCSTLGIGGGIIAVPPSAQPQTVITPFKWHYDIYYDEYDTSKEQKLASALATIFPGLCGISREYKDDEWYKELLDELSKLSETMLSKIKSVYAEVFGVSNHNSYSMLVHSHSENDIVDNSACLYTGDAEIKNKTLENTIIGLKPHYIQVPHHGSSENHNPSIYFRRQIAFMSVGRHNTYGHPGMDTIMDLTRICPYIHIITEHVESKFKKNIKF